MIVLNLLKRRVKQVDLKITEFCNCILEELVTNFSLYEFGTEAKSVKENTNNAEAVSLLLNNKKAEKEAYECMQRPELFNNEHEN